MVILVVGIFVAWSIFPWFAKPSGDRYALWPASTKEVMSVKAPIDRFLTENEKKNIRETFVPLPEVRRLISSAGMRTANVSRMSLLKTVQDGGGWIFGNGEIDFKEVISPVAILEVDRSAREALRTRSAYASSRETIGDSEVLLFKSPDNARDPWYVAAPTDKVLAFGQKEGIEQVLSVASGQRDAITSRGVLGPMLRDLENSNLLQATFITPTQEASVPVLQAIATLLQSIPGPSLFFSLRGQASAYEELPDGGCVLKIEYQARGRVGGLMFKMFLLLMRTQISGEGGVVVSVDHEDGLARLIAVGDPSKCPGLEKTKAPAR
ncbi:MAG TPA: hypothetical protein VGS22_24825 [Thermoanaerobaculia bacterium]|jgi:hypothetical protein|nr:hypothetical protein [Thermoanaerobaculia bacterium]